MGNQLHGRGAFLLANYLMDSHWVSTRRTSIAELTGATFQGADDIATGITMTTGGNASEAPVLPSRLTCWLILISIGSQLMSLDRWRTQSQCNLGDWI